MKTAQRGKYAFDDFKTFLNVSRKISKKGHKNYFRNEKKKLLGITTTKGKC